VKDPGPNLLEQIIESNTLLGGILAGAGAPTAGPAAGFGSLGILHPALFLDACEGTFVWAVTGTGVDYVCQYEVLSAFIGIKGLLMQTKATTPASGDRVDAIMILPGPENPWVVIQIMFAIPQGTSSTSEFIIDFLTGDPGGSFTSHVNWSFNIPDVRYYRKVGAGGQSIVLGPGANLADHAWNHTQICFNHKTGQWGFIKTNGIKYDLTADYLADSGAISNIPIVRLTLTLRTLTTAQAGIDLDQLLLTSHAELPD